MTATSGRARVGCSGWVYRDWRGLVYPEELPARRWFEHYTTLFDTVEINNTFYRLPPESTVDLWAGQAPPGFCYSVKVGQFGSHRKKLIDAKSWLPRHLERVVRLGHHLGPNLLQLPPRWTKNVERLDEFLSVTDPALRWAVEIRDPSWLSDDVFETLARHRAALCIHDMIADHPWELTADWTYLRFHGPDAVKAKYQGRYGPDRLRPLAERLAHVLASGVDVYAYFNNDWDANAVADALTLRDAIEASLPAATAAPGPGLPPPAA